MSYKILFTKNALNDIKIIQKSGNKQVLKNLEALFVELQEHPKSGTRQIETLKHFSEETFSRRINREHQLVYQIKDEIVTVLVFAVFGHYWFAL